MQLRLASWEADDAAERAVLVEGRIERTQTVVDHAQQHQQQE